MIRVNAAEALGNLLVDLQAYDPALIALLPDFLDRLDEMRTDPMDSAFVGLARLCTAALLGRHESLTELVNETLTRGPELAPDADGTHLAAPRRLVRPV